MGEHLYRALEDPFDVGSVLVIERGVECDPDQAGRSDCLGGPRGKGQPARSPHLAQEFGQPGLVDRRAVLVQAGHDLGIGVDSDDGETGLCQAGRDHHAEVPEPHNGDRGVLLSGHVHTLACAVAAILAAGGYALPMEASEHARAYFDAVGEIAAAIDVAQVDAMARGLAAVRERGGRLFIVGVGGGAGHASHAVNDFRKLCLIESYAPTDNVSELTARTNDDGWDTSFTEWLAVSRLVADDALLVFSVGGGSREHNVSVNVVNAIERAHELGAAVYGVVGAPGGTLAQLADVAVVIRAPDHLKTPLVESFQAVVWHALVSHPELAARQGHWESTRRRPGRGPVSGARAAFVDRDGTINELVLDPRTGRPESPLRVEDVALIPGAAGALRRLAAGGWLLVGVSNQPAAAKGTARPEQLADVQARVLELLAAEGARLDGFRICPHHPEGVVPELTGPCDCRKPAPGMLLDAARELEIDLERSWMIGDTDSDVLAGAAAGCRTVLIEQEASSHKRKGTAQPDAVTPDLQAAAALLLGEEPVN